MKIFGIGMPRTGTTSLNAALVALGYKALHFPQDSKTLAELKAGQFCLSILEKYDGLTDIPTPAIYPQLDQCFPGSKFILTTRDVNDWLESCESVWFNQSQNLPKPGSLREYYRTLIYGCVQYHRDRYRWVYESHIQLVMNYFSGEKADQLLVMDIIAGDGWEKLCPFLGVEIPDLDFPHRGKLSAMRSSPKRIKRSWARKIIRGLRSIDPRKNA